MAEYDSAEQNNLPATLKEMAKTGPKNGLLPITPEKLRDRYVKELKSLASALVEVAEEMEEAGIKKLPVMNQPTANNGLEFVERLVSSCKTNLAKAKRDIEASELNKLT